MTRYPRLVALWIVALLVPPLVGLLPFDRMLVPLLDLRPAARLLVQAPADDTLLLELGKLAPSLAGGLAGGALVSTMIGVPLLWLVAAFVAARSIDSPLRARVVAARGLAVMLIALPLRLLPIIGAIAIGAPIAHARTIDDLLPTLVAALATYAIGSALVTILVDLARGAALADPSVRTRSAFAAAFAIVRRTPRLVLTLALAELLLGAVTFAAMAVTRPLGLFRGATLVVAALALVIRAAGSVAIVARATGAATRSA